MPAPMRPQPRTPTVLICIFSVASCQLPVSSSRESRTANRESDAFHDCRDPLPAADAGGREAAFQTAPAELECQRQQQARAGHPQWMAERDRAAVDVHAIAIESEVFFDRKVLGRECLVDL